MLTDKDIQKLTKVFLTKEDFDNKISKTFSVFATKEDVKDIRDDISGLRESVQSLILTIDKFVKTVEDLRQEAASATLKMNRHEIWIQQIAEKVGVQLKY